MKDEGDRQAHDLLARAAGTGPAGRRRPLRGGPRLRPPPDRQRVWIVDPLDGTNEFGEAARPDWAVHVALVVDGPPVAAAVALPAVGVTFAHPTAAGRATPRRPATAGRRQPLPLAPGRRIVAQGSAPTCVRLGSAGAKAMAVVLGEADVYAHSRRHVRVGLGRAGRRGRGGRAARQPHRRLPPRLQQPRPLAARPPDLPARAGRAGAGTRCGPEGHPLRGRRPGRDGLAAPAPPPQRLDGADARRVPLDHRRARRRRRGPGDRRHRHARRRSASAPTATRSPATPSGRLRPGRPTRRRRATASGRSSTTTSPGTTAYACR